jgi:predicted DNA-binding transcriptional regulator
MQRPGIIIDKNVENAVREILKSRARSRIYIYLLRKNGAKTEQIIKGTRLHPSTVRETLSKMYDQKLIYRKKIKNDSIGKNPYIYYSIPPITLIQKYKDEIEKKLNKIANLAFPKKTDYRPIRIKIKESSDRA